MVIVITGNPGVGKHTIAERLAAENQKLELVDINKIAMQNKSVIKKSEETHDIDVKKLKVILKGIITSNSLVVGHLAPYLLAKRQVKIAIVLRKNPYELKAIYKKRRYSEKKTRDNQASEILGIIAHDTITKFGYQKTVQIDTTDKSIKQTIQVIQEALLLLHKDNNTTKNRKDPIIDWLALVNAKKRLGKVLSN